MAQRVLITVFLCALMGSPTLLIGSGRFLSWQNPVPGRAGSHEVRAQAREDQFLKALDEQHNLAVRTADALRKVVLSGAERTRCEKYSAGRVDPYMQLLLMACQEYEGAEDANSKLGFFREMRSMYAAADTKVQAALEMAMKERHHRDKMMVLEAKSGGEPTEDEIRKIAAGPSDT